MAAAIIPSMAMIGGGIDFGRAYLAKSKLQGAVDSGALAAVRAKMLGSNTLKDAEKIGKDYMKANFPAGYVGSTLAVEKVEVAEASRVVTADVTASGTVNTTLLRLVGIDTLPFSAKATARASDVLPRNVEAMLVLDNTGSMKGRKMKDLKKAATDFVETVYRGQDKREGVAIGILPYNINVNVGRILQGIDNSSVVNYPHFTDTNQEEVLSWKGCVVADPTVKNISSDPFTQDTGAYDVTKLLPGEEGMPPVTPYIYPPINIDSFDDINNYYKVPWDRRRIMEIPVVKAALVKRFGNDICVSRDNESQDRACDQDASVVSIAKLPTASNFKDARIYATSTENVKAKGTRNRKGPSTNYVCPAPAMPVSYDNTRQKLIDYIAEDNDALPNLGTFHTPAMTWAYRLLERDDFFTRDRPEDKPTNKVLIFMTDGVFDSRDDGRTDSSGTTLYDTAYTAYGTYEDRKMTDTATKSATIAELEKRFRKVCEAAKSDGIDVYTIAFELKDNNIKNLFKACATDGNTHYFDASNGAELQDAFLTIAAELINLRLVQ